MNNYIILVICVCILLTGCQRIEKKSFPRYFATIENRTISEKQIDSLISSQIYQLRKNALKTLLRSTIIDLQVQKQNISKEALLKKIFSKSNIIDVEQYQKYLTDNKIDSKNTDTTKIVDYLIGVNKQKHYENYADSLLAKANVRIELKPDNYIEVNSNEISYHELTFGKKLIVYIISDYNCNACLNAEKRLRKIISIYANVVSFRYVYFSEYIDRKALLAEAAASQGKFVEFHDFLFDHPAIKAGDQSLLEFAEKIGLDMKLFEENIFDPATLKHLMVNKERIIKQNIYVTPSYVINNKLINDEFALYTLENLINEELEKNQ